MRTPHIARRQVTRQAGFFRDRLASSRPAPTPEIRQPADTIHPSSPRLTITINRSRPSEATYDIRIARRRS